MKVVLRADVEGVGTAGEVVEVANGFARNSLIPRGLALRAAGNAVVQAEAMAKARDARAAHALEAAQELARQLDGATVTIAARASDQDQLYGSVTVADIAEASEIATGIPLDRKAISIAEPIRTIGTHEVGAEVHPEVSFTFAVEVVRLEP